MIHHTQNSNMFRRFYKRTLALLCAFCIMITTYLPVDAKDQSTAISMGVDVSRYQGDINWGALAASGVQFAFIRVGSTKYGIDAKFHQNMILANAAGIKTGVYIYSYATNVQEAANEAMFVLAAIQNYTVNMPVVIDIEDNLHKTLTPAQQADIANTFCAIVEAAGYYPMVYGSKNWFLTRMGPIAYDKWVAQYYVTCDIEDAAFWQASSSGVLPGIAGRVDIDYQYKDLSQSIIPYGFLYRKGNYYFYENYKMKTNSFVNFNGGMFFVDEWGRRVSGFHQIGADMFFFNQDGLMLTGLQNLAGNTYYFGLDGKMAVGLTKIGDQLYMFDTNGCMYRGWLSSDALYYFYEDGHMALGLSTIGTDHYYFDANGHLTVGWQDIAGAKYFFNPVGGKMMYGWINDGTGIYYTDSSGRMTSGIITVDNSVYNMGTDGRMLFGWQKVGGANCFFDLTTGKMYTGWNIIGTDTYYFDPASGAMQTGWLNVNGGTYYLGADGKMRIGMQSIDGAVYYFGVDGKLQSGFVSDGINTYYFDPTTAAQMRGFVVIGTDTYYFDGKSGIMYTGLQTIGGQTYLFDASGKMMKGWQVIGVQKFYFGPDGALMKGIINDGTGLYYLDMTDGHLLTNTVVTVDNVVYVIDANGAMIAAQ